MLKLDLTAGQKLALSGLFAEVEDGNSRGIGSAIVAQVWPDGMVCKRVYGKAGAALAKALGGTWGESISSAEVRVAKSVETPEVAP